MLGLLFCKGTLLAHVRLVHQDCQVPLCKTGFQLPHPQPVLRYVFIPFGELDLTFPFIQVPIRPFLHPPVRVPITQCSQFCIFSKLAESTFCPIIPVTNNDAKCYWTYLSWPCISSRVLFTVFSVVSRLLVKLGGPKQIPGTIGISLNIVGLSRGGVNASFMLNIRLSPCLPT